MKRFSCSDSLNAFISICSSKEERPSSNNVRGYSKEFQAMLDSLDQEDSSEDGGPIPERKRRLRFDQVKALERHFEVENKLEPERKMKIAAELDLEPRQVTIWFQNRRARWKTKQLERDYGLLKVNYDALKLDYDILENENATLASKLRELREKLSREGAESNNSFRENNAVLELGSNVSEQSKSGNFWQKWEGREIKIQTNLIDGTSESDSNGVVNEARDGNSFLSANNSSLSSMLNGSQLSNVVAISGNVYENQSQFMKTTEEQSLFSTEEPCNFCSVDQAPSLHW